MLSHKEEPETHERMSQVSPPNVAIWISSCGWNAGEDKTHHHAINDPSKIGPTRPFVAIFVSIDGPPGLSMAP